MVSFIKLPYRFLFYKLKNNNTNIKISYILACYLDAIYKHIIFVENSKQKVMKILTNKKYRELTSYIATLEDKADLLSGVLKQNRQLSSKISELEPIVEKFNHKKKLEKARKQKYMAKLKLNKKQAVSPDDNTKGISKAEEFVRLMSSENVLHYII